MSVISDEIRIGVTLCCIMLYTNRRKVVTEAEKSVKFFQVEDIVHKLLDLQIIYTKPQRTFYYQIGSGQFSYPHL